MLWEEIGILWDVPSAKLEYFLRRKSKLSICSGHFPPPTQYMTVLESLNALNSLNTIEK